jgi:hypothetical protein
MKTLLKLTVFAWSIFAISQIEAFMYPMVSKDGELLALNIDPDVPGTSTISAQSMYDAISKKFGKTKEDITIFYNLGSPEEQIAKYSDRFIVNPVKLEIITGDTFYDNTWYFLGRMNPDDNNFHKEENIAINKLNRLVNNGKVAMEADKATDHFMKWLEVELQYRNQI